MRKNLIVFVLTLVITFTGCSVNQSFQKSNSQSKIAEKQKIDSKTCKSSLDCVVFGKTGDCNCGCYNQNSLPSEIDEACFCAAPTSCDCINNQCEGIF